MRVQKSVSLDSLCEMLTGLKQQEGIDPWRSKLRALSKAISFVENEPHFAPELLSHSLLQNLSSKGRIVGITGLPGAGKSSLTNLIIKELRAVQKSVAVFAVDPSSSQSGGALLGDRIRMQEHFQDPQVYIRSQGARGALGGVARATRNSIRLASLLGFDYILVETVGIGQSESEIIDIADTSILVLMPHSGDEIQLLKAGILQLANIYIINKCDLGDPSRMVQEIEENTMPTDPGQWIPRVLKTSTLDSSGIERLVAAFLEHEEFELKQPKGNKNAVERVKKEILQNLLILMENEYKPCIEKLNEKILNDVFYGKVTAMMVAKSMIK
ncbi:MAG: methylmalonyl Co-A mutase-associated GTPase MeaB [Silvanigrellaceae bacterium]|nr:methylmalonyl Co-A mutase-associated GTPase MeaB [Silvanigrellaceae bacterium]